MDQVKQKILTVLRGIELPDGQNLISLDLIRALSISNGVVSFVIEVEAAKAKDFDNVIEKAKQEIGSLENISKVSIVLTSHNKVIEDNKGQPPKLVASQASRRCKTSQRCGKNYCRSIWQGGCRKVDSIQ